MIAAATGSARNVPTMPNAVAPTATANSADERVEMNRPAEDRRHHHHVLDLAKHEQEHDRGDRERGAARGERHDPDDGSRR